MPPLRQRSQLLEAEVVTWVGVRHARRQPGKALSVRCGTAGAEVVGDLIMGSIA